MFFPAGFYPPIDQRIQLDKCWRQDCFEPVDPDDELGLCAKCRTELKSGVVKPVAERELEHGERR